jgi:hypothetical protein
MTYIVGKNIEDVYTTEEDKNTFEYLHKSIDYNIAQLVYERDHIRKARNLYEGVRDEEEFKYLQETFGIETPLALKMTPLVKTRVDVLLGILLDETFTYRVTVNDSISIDDINKQKIEEKVKRIRLKYQEQLDTNQKNIQQGRPVEVDFVTQKYLKSVDGLINETFISSFEIAAQSLITFFSQDPTVDLKQKVKLLFLDLLVTGEAYYKTYVNKIGTDPILDIIKPENIFFNKNTNDQFMSTGNKPNVHRVVHREYMKSEEILTRWGHLLGKEDKEDIFGKVPLKGTGNTNIVRSAREIEYSNKNVDGIIGKTNQYTRNGTDYIPVYYVEWLANNEITLDEEEKDDLQVVNDSKAQSKEYSEYFGKDRGTGKVRDKAYRLDKYEGIRIGYNIYVNCGKSRHSVRSIGSPWQTKLSYNGVGYNERNGESYSLAWSLKDLQDSFDIIMFFRDNLIANSGVDGSRINLAAIPKVLGTDFMERLLKFMALRKQGIELIDPTEDGATLFQHYGEFRASMDGNVIASLNAVLETIQAQADIVSGVNRYMYQAAEVRDAVKNVKAGQQTTSLITKDLFELIHTTRRYVILDLINRARYSYIKGKRGSYIVGHRSVLFDIQAKDFCFTDYNIQVVNSSAENAKLEKLSAAVPELIIAGAIDPEVLVQMIMSDSTTEILQLITQSIRERKESNSQVGQLEGQVEQMTTEIKDTKKVMDSLNKIIEANKAEELRLKNRELSIKERAEVAKVENNSGELDRKTRKDIADNEKDRELVQLEREQLYAENAAGNSKEIKNNV